MDAGVATHRKKRAAPRLCQLKAWPEARQIPAHQQMSERERERARSSTPHSETAHART